MTIITQPILLLIFIPLIGVFVILFTNNDKVNMQALKGELTPSAGPKGGEVTQKNNTTAATPASAHLIVKQALSRGSAPDSVLYNIALFFSLLNLFISVVMWYFFNNYNSTGSSLNPDVASPTSIELGTQFQFIFEINHFSFGIDGISIFFVLLTTFITPIAIFSSYELYVSYKSNSSSDKVAEPEKSIIINSSALSPSALGQAINKVELDNLKNKNLGLSTDNTTAIVVPEQRDSIKIKIFLISLLLLESLQICAFVSLDLLLFYVFFESVLPVLFILIVVFGHGENRYRSAFLLFLYTLAGSLPMLLSILTIYSYLDSTDYQLISFNEISLESQKWLWIGFFIALAVKTPLVPFSIWLPKAHGDSPLAGSIILAATILKLATYFYLRVLINYLPDASNYFSPLVQTIAVISIIYASFATIVQEDTKRLIAYSSVAHMGVVVLGLFSNTLHGIEGAILLSLAHGWVSPALFICVGGIVYERTGTRIIYYIRGLANMMPIFTIMFFVFTLANTGIPLSLNFLGEQLALMGIWEVNPLVAALGASGILLSACYSLFLMNRLSYGDYSPYLYPVKDLNRREYHLLLSLIIPTFFFGVFPNVILEGLHTVGTSLLYS
jgi:proton-translocating NADH-quinone oxidoreductase chain M